METRKRERIITYSNKHLFFDHQIENHSFSLLFLKSKFKRTMLKVIKIHERLPNSIDPRNKPVKKIHNAICVLDRLCDMSYEFFPDFHVISLNASLRLT